MATELSDIGARLFHLLTECRAEWIATPSGWLERGTIALKDVGGFVSLFTDGECRPQCLTAADMDALVPVVKALRASLESHKIAEDVRAVRVALGLEQEAK